MAGSLQVAVRTLHVLGVAVLLGGAGALWYAARRDDGAVDSLAGGYERAFWGVLGVMVVTGVGNLGALGAPGPHTRWGAVLSAKLGVVAAFVLGSVVRTSAVALLDDGNEDDGERVRGAFYRRAYGLTTAALVALVAAAEVLAHG